LLAKHALWGIWRRWTAVASLQSGEAYCYVGVKNPLHIKILWANSTVVLFFAEMGETLGLATSDKNIQNKKKRRNANKL